ncbi:methyltransferase domain-containing protein [Gilvibacter sediminis]|uniref:methyltransferase domain-containing protein n=1 Tax=Gilvibacter sediminis TaxID=379071 RepID=UPI002350BCC8|nr:methyltransferase domain-containing protein [Gilvibacter sediminis]MDC7997932.1 methyltransferase domain-containing protein [Gilvibacter sediminis]
MKKTLILLLLLAPLWSCQGQTEKQEGPYTFKSGDRNGTGKWYMGREIAFVMGYQGMGWLERPEREKEENVSALLANMEIGPNDDIADIGAGSGYHVFRMAPLASQGTVYGVDIQNEMLAAMEYRKEALEASNVNLVKSTEKTANLPANSVDKVLIVDVYHEFSFPVEMMASIYQAMRPDAKLYLIEYRGEDPTVPIKETHKMTEAQAVKEMEAAGFKLVENIDNLPWQHCMVFAKAN